MKYPSDKISKSVARRQDALEMFQAKRKEFLTAREQIIRDIEEARTLWQNTLKQLPDQPFSH